MRLVTAWATLAYRHTTQREAPRTYVCDAEP
jgi:hypothetical protein